MQYMILIYGDERNFAALANDADAQKQMYAAYTRYGTDMREALRGRERRLGRGAAARHELGIALTQRGAGGSRETKRRASRSHKAPPRRASVASDDERALTC